MFNKKRFLSLFSLIAAGGIIYVLPYMRQSYHATMIEVLEVTNTELGVLNAVFGIFAVICYVPGGWLADRYDPRTLLTVSLTGSGLAGLYFATLPSYAGMMAVHAIWGVTTILTFWAAFVKATRETGTEQEQAKVFGIVEGGRGLFEAVLGAITVALFAAYATKAEGLQAVIFMHGALCVLVGGMLWLVLPKEQTTTKVDVQKEQEHSSTDLMLMAMRLPSVWLMAVIVLCAYSCYWGTFSLSYFATDGFEQTDVYGATLSNFRMWFRPFAAVAAGYIAMRMGTQRFILGAFVLMGISYFVLTLMPTGIDTLWLLWADTAMLAFLVFSLRAVYFALLEESKIPLHLTGMAVGIISVIGYLPDVFFPLLTGWLYDNYPGAVGHQILFGGLSFAAIVGFSATWMLTRMNRKRTLETDLA